MMKLGGATGAGGGSGTVTSVTGQKPIVVTPATPNPDVTFEVVRDTQAVIAAMELAGTLANGGWYTITDMNAPLLEATFVAIVDHTGLAKLSQFGTGIFVDGGGGIWHFSEVGYNLQGNTIFHLHQDETNQTATRPQSFPATNCIENVDWFNLIQWRDNVFFDCNLNSVILSSCTVQGNRVETGAIIEFQNNGNIVFNFNQVHQNALVDIKVAFVQITNSIFREGSMFVASSATTFNDIDLGPEAKVDSATFSVDGLTAGPKFQFTLLSNAVDRIIIDGVNNFIEEMDAAANYAALTLTIPATHQHVGTIRLTNAAGGNINKIVGNSTRFNTNFECTPVIANIFQPTTIGLVAANDITSILPAVAPYVVTGFAAASDRLEVMRVDTGGGVPCNFALKYNLLT